MNKLKLNTAHSH